MREVLEKRNPTNTQGDVPLHHLQKAEVAQQDILQEARITELIVRKTDQIPNFQGILEYLCQGDRPQSLLFNVC